VSTYLNPLPKLDLHAHIAPDVTQSQLRALQPAYVFAVTRSLTEAELVRNRRDDFMIWGCGVHPGVEEALNLFSKERLLSLLQDFFFVGEIGLDKRAGQLERQMNVFSEILVLTIERNLVLSIHSSGCTDLVVNALQTHRPRGAILHWFTGSESLVAKAVDLGAFFSVNVLMKDEQIATLPIDRLLPETDFPAGGRKRGASVPGDVLQIEKKIAALHHIPEAEIRSVLYENLRSLALQAGVSHLLPTNLRSHLDSIPSRPSSEG
jgi:TatD DNase family protein